MKKLIREYYKSDGSIAKVFHNTDQLNDSVSYYSIAYVDSSGSSIGKEEFYNRSIHYVEDAAENWALGIKQVLLG